MGQRAGFSSFKRVVVTAAAAMLVVSACKRDATTEAQLASASAEQPKPGPVSLNCAGATAEVALYSRWTSEYGRLHPDVFVNYHPMASAAAVGQLFAQTVDFGATEAPMPPSEKKNAPAAIAQLPVALSGIAIVYNLAGVTGLNLTPAALADIYLGVVTRWNDRAIADANPAAKLPDSGIVVLYRGDESAASAALGDYLGNGSQKWKERVGGEHVMGFSVGRSVPGSGEMAAQLKASPGSIGYLELPSTVENALSIAAIENARGRFVRPDAGSIARAAAGVDVANAPRTLLDSSDDAAYPLTSFAYALTYVDARDAIKREALVTFLSWVIHDGQKLLPTLHYAALPERVVAKAEGLLEALHSGTTRRF
jgi:phosphate transport system substrate-binding protein